MCHAPFPCLSHRRGRQHPPPVPSSGAERQVSRTAHRSLPAIDRYWIMVPPPSQQAPESDTRIVREDGAISTAPLVQKKRLVNRKGLDRINWLHTVLLGGTCVAVRRRRAPSPAHPRGRAAPSSRSGARRRRRWCGRRSRSPWCGTSRRASASRRATTACCRTAPTRRTPSCTCGCCCGARAPSRAPRAGGAAATARTTATRTRRATRAWGAANGDGAESALTFSAARPRGA